MFIVWAVEGITLLEHTEQVIRQNALRSKMYKQYYYNKPQCGCQSSQNTSPPPLLSPFAFRWLSFPHYNYQYTYCICGQNVKQTSLEHCSSCTTTRSWRMGLLGNKNYQHTTNFNTLSQPYCPCLQPTKTPEFESSAAVRIVHNSIRRHSSPKLDCQVVCHIVEG